MRPRPSSESRRFRASILAAAGLLACLGAVRPGPARAASARAQTGWYVVKTDRFKLFSHLGERPSLQIARDLERLDAVLGQMFRGTPRSGGTPTRIFAFRDPDSFQSYGLTSALEASPGLAGFFTPTPIANFIVVDAGSGNDYRRIIRHEQTHLHLHQTRGEVSLWLDEGFAEYLSTLRVDDRRIRVGEPIAHHLDRLARGEWLPLNEFLAMTADSVGFDEAHQAGLFHAQSWLLLHFLLHDGGGLPWSPERLLELEEIPHEKSLLSELGWDGEELHARLREYASRTTFGSASLPGSPPGTDPTLRRVGRPSILTRLGELAAFVRDDSELAERFFRTALRIEPTRPGPNAGLGFLLDLEGRHEQAGIHFDRAVALIKGDSRIPLMRGLALLQRFEQETAAVFIPADELDPLLARARDEFALSLHAEPDLAEAHAGLGATYLYDSGNPEHGIASLEQARELLPHRMDLAADLALLYAHAGDSHASRAMMDLVERRSRDRALVDRTRQLLILADRGAIADLVERGRAGEARAALIALIDGVTDPQLRSNLEAGLEAMLHSLEPESAPGPSAGP